MRKKLSALLFLIPNFSFLIIFYFSSCSTIPADKAIHERPVVSESPQALVPGWKPFAPEAEGALAIFTGRTTQPRLEFWAVRIDLASPRIEIVTAPGGITEGGTGAVSIKVSSFVRNNKLLAGINALPFEPTSDIEGEHRSNFGIVISQGRILSPLHPDFDALVFYTDGSAAILPQREITSVVHIENAVGGFYQILENGSPSARTENNNDRYPRSAAGISADGKFLYLLVVDGRRPLSVGSTEAETAIILRQLGAWDGTNFDGGGSSSLALRFPDGNIAPVNKPSHGGIPGRERAVAGCLGVRLINEE